MCVFCVNTVFSAPRRYSTGKIQQMHKHTITAPEAQDAIREHCILDPVD